MNDTPHTVYALTEEYRALVNYCECCENARGSRLYSDLHREFVRSDMRCVYCHHPGRDHEFRYTKPCPWDRFPETTKPPTRRQGVPSQDSGEP